MKEDLKDEKNKSAKAAKSIAKKEELWAKKLSEAKVKTRSSAPQAPAKKP